MHRKLQKECSDVSHPLPRVSPNDIRIGKLAPARPTDCIQMSPVLHAVPSAQLLWPNTTDGGAFTQSGGRESKTEVPADSVPPAGSLAGLQTAVSLPCPHRRESPSPWGVFYKGTNPIIRAPPPNITTLRAGVSTGKWGAIVYSTCIQCVCASGSVQC